MASEGPTTVGSIDAKLNLDIDAFERKSAEVKAKAKELGDTEVHIKADADTARAMAQLTELQIAERRLTAAELDLDKVQKNRSATQQQLLRAQNAADQAAISYLRTQERIKNAQDNEAESTKRSTTQHKAQFSVFSILGAAAGPLIGMLAGMGAAAVGLAAAMGVMGAAGLVAIFGIKKEMADGTRVGAAYSQGLGLLKDDFETLSRTAAVNMLQGFQKVVGDINSRLPFLNQLIGEMSYSLGTAGSITLDALLTALQRMYPLIQSGARAFEDLSVKLLEISKSQGFGQFVDYAVQNMPNLLSLVGQLVVLVAHVVAAFAPLASVTVPVITAIVQGLNSLPLPILAALIAGLGSLSTAFNIAKIAAVTFGIESSLAVPVIGILLAGVVALAAGVLSANGATNDAAAAQQAYRSELEQTNGVIDESIRATVAKQVADGGLADAAHALGLTLGDITDAVMGNQGAMEKVTKASDTSGQAFKDQAKAIMQSKGSLDEANEAGDAYAANADKVHGFLTANSAALQDQAQKQRSLTEAMKQGSGELTTQQLVQQQLATQLGVTAGAVADAQKKQDQNKASTEQATVAMQLQNDAAGLLRQALDALNGKTLSLEQAQNNAASATNAVTKSFQQNTTSLAGNSEKAIANRNALLQKAQADQNAAEAVGKATGSTKDATAAYANAKAQLERNLQAQGLLTDEVRNYINKIYQIPKSVPPTKIDVDISSAQSNLSFITQQLRNLNGMSVTTYIDTVNRGGSMGFGKQTEAPFADGGAVEYHDWGGSAGSASRGTDTVRAVLTVGEEVVRRPAAMSMRRNHPGALEYINQYGTLPPQGQGPINFNPTILVQNPFTGEMVQAVMVSTADERINASWKDASRRRIGVS